MSQICPTLNVPQTQFLQLPHKFKAYVAGFGSGKTWVGCTGIGAHFWQWPGINQGYFAPTYPQIRDIFYPMMEEVAFTLGLRTKVKVSGSTTSRKWPTGLRSTTGSARSCVGSSASRLARA